MRIKLMYMLVASCLMLFLVETSFGVAVHSGRRDSVAARHLSMARKRLRTQFGFPLPSSARAECTGKSPDGRVLFLCVRMPAGDAARFKNKLIESRRAGTQRFVYEDKESFARIGDIPTSTEPETVKAWKTKNSLKGGETLIHIESKKRVGPDELRVLSYLVMFSQESQGLAYFYFYPTKG